MRNLISACGVLVMLGLPFSSVAQESRHYEDKAHHDSHDWNAKEDEAYRRYLAEHHRKAQEFAKANRREQSNYWNWRHAHPDK